MRWMTRKRTGSRPIVSRASSSSLTFIVPISAANAEPERPARMIAVKIGENSRTMTRPIMSAMKIWAPNISRGCAASKAITRPMSRLMRETIGRALTPAFSKTTPTSRQRMRRGRRSAAAKPWTTAPMKIACARRSANIDWVAAPISARSGRLGGAFSRSANASSVGKAASRFASSGRRPVTFARTPGASRPSASS